MVEAVFYSFFLQIFSSLLEMYPDETDTSGWLGKTKAKIYVTKLIEELDFQDYVSAAKCDLL